MNTLSYRCKVEIKLEVTVLPGQAEGRLVVRRILVGALVDALANVLKIMGHLIKYDTGEIRVSDNSGLTFEQIDL